MDLLLPFQFPFMQTAFLIALIVAIPTALLSCFLVLKGWALMGDAVSHAALPGIVLAYVAGLPLIAGAFVAGMICALATGYLAETSRVKPDTVMGVVFSGMFALGIVLYVGIDTAAHLDHILFGNILGVSQSELMGSGLIAAAVSLGLLAFWRDLMLQAFDPAQARASGLSVRWLHYGLLSALSLTVVAVLNAVELILAVGLMIAPGAIAFLLTRRFGTMLLMACLVSTLALTGGVYASFFLGSAPAPTVILILTCIFLIAFGMRMYRNKRTRSVN